MEKEEHHSNTHFKSVSNSRASSINDNLTDDALIVGTALDQLLDNLDNGTHLKSPPSEVHLRSSKSKDSVFPVIPDRSDSLKTSRSAASSSRDLSLARRDVDTDKKLPAPPPMIVDPPSQITEAVNVAEATPTSSSVSNSPTKEVNYDSPFSPTEPNFDTLPSSDYETEEDDVTGPLPHSNKSISMPTSPILSRTPLTLPNQDPPLRRQSQPTFMDIALRSTRMRTLSSMDKSSQKKRDTAMSLLYTTPVARGGTTSSTVTDDSRVNLTNLNEIPFVNLPGFKPKLNPEPTLKPPVETGSPSLFRRLSSRRKQLGVSKDTVDAESGNALFRKRSLNDPSRSPRPRIHMVVQGGAPSATQDFVQSQRKIRDMKLKNSKAAQSVTDGPRDTIWRKFSRFITFYAPNPCLQSCGMSNRNVQQAWREKMALVTLIFLLCILLAFITFGFQYIACGLTGPQNTYPYDIFDSDVVSIRGDMYEIKGFQHPGNLVQLYLVAGRDVSWLFPLQPSLLPGGVSACDAVPGSTTASISCTVDGVPSVEGYCHTAAEYQTMLSEVPKVGVQSFTWEDVEGSSSLMIYNGIVLNLERYFSEGNSFLGGQDFTALLNSLIGKDATRAFVASDSLQKKMACLVERFKVGELQNATAGCFAADVFMYISLGTILCVLLIRFAIALIFNWFYGPRLGKNPPIDASLIVPRSLKRTVYIPEQDNNNDLPEYLQNRSSSKSSLSLPKKSRFSSQYNMQNRLSSNPYASIKKNNPRSTISISNTPRTSTDHLPTIEMADTAGILPTIMLVTCYSEDETGLRITLDSLAKTDFPDSHKLLFIIADGIVTGSGNSQSTPDILIDMITIDPQFEYPPVPHSYVAIADGQKRHNMAQVYAGRYHAGDHTIPTILVVKCGAPEEQTDKKPGNRGKRDSQILLMQFLSKVMFDDRMTPLEFDLFTKMTAVCSAPHGIPLDSCVEKITPDLFELVVMVDADTRVLPPALTTMSYAMASDPKLIGLCGETRIANKTASWITSIQVFEYFISHFLAKSFESVFGAVTCLPGCFCMYRVKAPKPMDDGTGYQYYVPILASPDIVEAYSENKVDTLHKKNLYLLGEDRYLTTLMLKTFPKRKLMFVPNAVCKTMVPDTFNVLLSQRRRWINSTAHNLLELVMVRDLCGIFCFSMQFVIFMELIGTAVLPAAISFTIYLIIISFIINPPPLIPLFLLAAILGLPAVLIFLSKPRRWVYTFWMIVYLLSLPIWNFVLPVYAYWHFDDFSWGETRKLEGMKDDKGHGEKEGLFDPSKIVMRRWFEWERIRRRQQALEKLNGKISRRNSIDSISETTDMKKKPIR